MNPLKLLRIASIMGEQAVIITKMCKEEHSGKALCYYILFETLEHEKQIIIALAAIQPISKKIKE